MHTGPYEVSHVDANGTVTTQLSLMCIISASTFDASNLNMHPFLKLSRSCAFTKGKSDERASTMVQLYKLPGY